MGVSAFTLTVTDGTAKLGIHYEIESGRSSIRSYTSTTNQDAAIGNSILTFANDDDEPDKTFTFSLTYNAGTLSLGNRKTATVIIHDDDPTVVSLARIGSSSAVDEGGTVEFTVILGRVFIAGEIIDVPLIISGTNITTADWSLAVKSGATLNTGYHFSE